jgi:TonB family protein
MDVRLVGKLSFRYRGVFMVKNLLSKNGFRGCINTVLRRELCVFSLLLTLFVVGVNAQSQATPETNSPSAEELEANKLSGDVLRLYREEKYQEALPLAKRVLMLREQKLGPEHQATLVSMNNLAAVYSRMNKHKEAIELYQRLLKTEEKLYGLDDPNLCETISKFGWIRIANNQERDAEALFKRHLQIQEKAFGTEHPNIMKSLNDLTRFYQRIGNIDQAINFYQRMIAIQEKSPEEKPEIRAERLVKCAALYRMKSKNAEADEMERQARKLYASKISASPTSLPGGVLQGNAILKMQPSYPLSAKQSRIQGTVRVSVIIDEIGIVTKAKAVDGPIELWRASEEAAMKWRFTPVELSGQRIQVQGVLTFNFTLQ